MAQPPTPQLNDGAPHRGRWVMAALDVATALFALALAQLLWTSNPGITAGLWLWSAIELASAVGLASATRWGRVTARVAALFQLALLALATAGLAASSVYLWGLYGQVGTGVAILLIGVVALLFELVGLVPIIKLRLVGVPTPWWRVGRWLALSVGIASASGAMGIGIWVRYPDWRSTPAAARAALGHKLLTGSSGGPMPVPGKVQDLAPSLYVVRLFSDGRLKRRTLVRGTPGEVIDTAGRLPHDPHGSRDAVVVDKVVATGPFSTSIPLLESLSIVPGLDGVGATADGTESVILPQELIDAHMLSAETPLPFVPDFKAGVRLAHVRRRLCQLAGRGDHCHLSGLHRLRTESWLTRVQGTTALHRGRPALTGLAPDAGASREGALAGGRYVLRALKPDGRYVYKLDPLTGRHRGGDYSIPRHAGTTWFLLTLGRTTHDPNAIAGAQRALDWLAGQVRDCHGGQRCIPHGRRGGLGSQALSLIAFADHARITGSDRYAPTIDALTAMVMALQKPDGDFRFKWDCQVGQPVEGPRQFYAAGQATLALSIAADLTGREEVRRAARRAMDYLSGPYWDFPAGDLFFLEEHWTCLAAEEAWKLFGDRRHAQLCVDIGSFYRHLQHRRGETVFADYVGGVGFSPFFPPHTTPTASRAEAMIAAYHLSAALGEPDEDIREGIGDAIAFLLHNQYTEADTYLFASPDEAVGGIPWNYLDPTVRIDTVQHASSVMLLGGPLL